MAVTRESLTVAVLVFFLSFPTFSYAFTSLTWTGTANDSPLNVNTLLSQGITVTNSTTVTLDYKAGWTEINLGTDGVYRISWDDYSDGIGKPVRPAVKLQKRTNTIDRLLGTWLFPENMIFKDPFNVGQMLKTISNETISANFDDSTSWSQFSFFFSGFSLFFTYNSTAYTSLDDSLFNGTVVVTLASLTDEGMSLTGFIQFYTGLILGDQTYGLPSFFSWLIRIITAVSILVLAYLIRDLIPI